MLLDRLGNGDLFACHCHVTEAAIVVGILVFDTDSLEARQTLYSLDEGDRLSFCVELPERLTNPAYNVTLKRCP